MNTLHKTWLAAAALALLTALPALADDPLHKPTPAAAAGPDLSDGEIRKIDLEAARITLRHGEIKSLDMPPMTMVFSVKDKAVLGRFKAGDKVRFKAVNEGGRLTVTELQAVP